VSPKSIVTPQNDIKVNLLSLFCNKNNVTRTLVSERSLEKDSSKQNITISKISPIPNK
jgi:hypothetical protein